MAIEKITQNVEDYLHWSTEEGDKGTKYQTYMDFVRNMYNVTRNILEAGKLWQPNQSYLEGDIIISPSMKVNSVAYVTKAGITGAIEPTWAAIGNTVSDGTVNYLIKKKIIDFATDAEVSAGTIPDKIVSPARLKKALTDGLTPKMNSADITNTFLWSLLHSKGVNFVPSDVTNTGWNKLGVFSSYYTKSVLKNQPTQYGQLINIPADKNSTESTQLWIEQVSGKIYYRGGNGSVVLNDTAFKTFPTTGDLDSQVSTLKTLINNAAASGGVVAGNVSNANAWWVKLGGTIPLIIQGGKSANTVRNENITFPIKFSVLYGVIGQALISFALGGSQSNFGIKTDNLTTSGFTTSMYDNGNYYAGFYWIAIGK